MTAAGSTDWYFASEDTGPPETFMYDIGTATTTAWPASRTVAALVRVFLCTDSAPPPRAASSSTTIWPMLWRVPAYSSPGLPRPITSALNGVSSWVKVCRDARGARHQR